MCLGAGYRSSAVSFCSHKGHPCGPVLARFSACGSESCFLAQCQDSGWLFKARASGSRGPQGRAVLCWKVWREHPWRGLLESSEAVTRQPHCWGHRRLDFRPCPSKVRASLCPPPFIRGLAGLSCLSCFISEGAGLVDGASSRPWSYGAAKTCVGGSI